MTNLALSALILLLLLIPGAIFTKGYYHSIISKQNRRYFSLEELITQGLFYCLILHVCFVCIIDWYGYDIDFDFLLSLLGGNDLPSEHGKIKSYFTQFMMYFFLCCLTAFILSKIARNFVHWTRLYQRFSYLQITNYWFELFSAEYMERIGVPGRSSDTHIVVVDLLTENDIIYSGFLEDYSMLPKSDNIQNIVLRYAKKKKFSAEKKTEFRDVAGDALIIPYSSVKNMNVYHVHMKDPSNDDFPLNHD